MTSGAGASAGSYWPSRSVSIHTTSPSDTSGTTPASIVGSVTGRPLGVGSVSATGLAVSVVTWVRGEGVDARGVCGIAVGAVGPGVGRGPCKCGGQRELDDVVTGQEVQERVPPERVGRDRGDDHAAGIEGRVAGGVEQRDGDAGDRRLGGVELTVLVGVDPDEITERHDRHDTGVDRRVGDRAAGGVGVGVDHRGGRERHDAGGRGGLRAAGEDRVAVETVTTLVRDRPGVAAGQREADAVVAGQQAGEVVAAAHIGDGGRDRDAQRIERGGGAGRVAQLDRDAGDGRLRGVEPTVAVGVDPDQVAERHERHDAGIDGRVGDRRGRCPSGRCR